MRFGDAAETFARYDDELHKMVKDMREHGDKQDGLLDKGAYKLAGDPLRPEGPPEHEAAVPDVAFAPLDAAIAKLKVAPLPRTPPSAKKAPACRPPPPPT